MIDLGIVWIGLLFVKLVINIVSFAGGDLFRSRLLFHYTLRDIILYLLQVVYFILLTYYTETTPGKRLLNLRVVSADRGKLSFVNVVYRETVGRFLCGLSIGIGYIMAGVDREKRGLHDMLCDTRVIYAKKIKVIPKYQALAMYPPMPPVPPSAPPYGRPPGGNGAGGYAPASGNEREPGHMYGNGTGLNTPLSKEPNRREAEDDSEQ